MMERSRACWRKYHINLRFLLCNLCVRETSNRCDISNAAVLQHTSQTNPKHVVLQYYKHDDTTLAGGMMLSQ